MIHPFYYLGTFKFNVHKRDQSMNGILYTVAYYI